ncbi:MAG: oligosaccharide flippase family protein [Chloroflexi bacterium]|nr:oligosaccharide flippase family protein [Chloroflexota bacterium]
MNTTLTFATNIRSRLPTVETLTQGKTATLLLLLFANGVSNLVQFVINIAVARMTDAAEFGVFSTLISIAMTASLLINAGSTVSLVRLLSGEQEERAGRFILQAVVMMELTLAMLMLGAAMLVTPQITVWLQVPEAHQVLVPLAIATAVSLTLLDVCRAFFQAKGKYSYLAWTALAYAAARMVCGGAVILTSSGEIRVETIFLATYTVPTLLLLMVFDRGPIAYLGFPHIAIDEVLVQMKRVIRYTQWTSVSSIGYPLLAQLPVFFLASGVSQREVGLYSAGASFAVVFSLLNLSIRQITLPTVSRFTTTDEVFTFLRKLRSLLPIYLLCSALVMVVMGFGITLLLGEKYRESLPVFLAIGSASACSIAVGQANLIAHALYKPHIGAYQTIIQGVALIVGLYLLVACGLSGALDIALWFGFVIAVGEILTFAFILRLILRYRQGRQSQCLSP